MGWNNRIGLGVFAAAIIAAPWLFPDSYPKLTQAGVFALVAIGLSLLFGYAGQISLGHAAFYAIGAYVSGILTARYGWSPWFGMGAGAALSAVVAVVVGLPSLRLHGHYLAMATLAFGEIVRVVLDAWVGVTGGPSGFGDIPALAAFGHKFNSITDERGVFWIVWAFAFAGLLIALCLIHSRIGRALRSIHGGELAANVLGVPTASYKVQVFVLSAIYASVAGSLYAHTVNYLNPPPFGLMTSILFAIMVIVGGMRTVWGAVAGATLMNMLPEWLSWMQDNRLVVYGAVLLAIMMFAPQGVVLGAWDLCRWAWRAARRERRVGPPDGREAPA